MKNQFLLLLGICLCALQPLSCEETGNFSFSLSDEVITPNTIKILIETSHCKEYNIDTEALKHIITTHLEKAGFSIEKEATVPYILVRINGLTAQETVTSFVQLSYYEEATLKRNQHTLYAMTWSKATLLASLPKTAKEEINHTVLSMLDAFTKEYKKALAS